MCLTATNIYFRAKLRPASSLVRNSRQVTNTIFLAAIPSAWTSDGTFRQITSTELRQSLDGDASGGTPHPVKGGSDLCNGRCFPSVGPLY